MSVNEKVSYNTAVDAPETNQIAAFLVSPLTPVSERSRWRSLCFAHTAPLTPLSVGVALPLALRSRWQSLSFGDTAPLIPKH